MKSRIRDRKATVPEKETAWKSDHKCQSYRRRREHERKWAISAFLRRLVPKAMKLRIRDRKVTVLKEETAWKSDHKWQSYRRRREHERKWAFSASLRRFLPKAMKLRIWDRKVTVPEKETAWKSDDKWQSYRGQREHERKWAFSASLGRLWPKPTYEVKNLRSKSDGTNCKEIYYNSILTILTNWKANIILRSIHISSLKQSYSVEPHP